MAAIYNSFVFDAMTRMRVVGLAIDYHILDQNPLLPPDISCVASGLLAHCAARLSMAANSLAPALVEMAANSGLRVPLLDFVTQPMALSATPALTHSERTRLRCILDAAVAALYGLDASDLRHILRACDLPVERIRAGDLDPKGFWRLDKELQPELRHTVLTQVAFAAVLDEIDAGGGDRDKGVSTFLARMDGEGWLLPETVCLADYRIGHDDGAESHQPVASVLGPRFYDWQLACGTPEVRRETHLHARNLLGRKAYAGLIDRVIERSDDLSRHDFARDLRQKLVARDASEVRYTGSTDLGAPELRVAQGHPGSVAEPSSRPSQTEIFPLSQADLFD